MPFATVIAGDICASRCRRFVWMVVAASLLLGITYGWVASRAPADPKAENASTTSPRTGVNATVPAEFPQELVAFEPGEGKIVFQGAGPGHWDAKLRERGWILRDGNQWRLWYTGYDGTREGLKMLGTATSPDGLHWTRDPANPLDREQWIEDMMVVRHDGTFYMFAEGRADQAHWFTSADGLHWTRRGTLNIRQTDDKPIEPGPFGTPTVWHESGMWYLMYERGDRGVWLARSPDLKFWINVQDDPVLRPGPDAYDRQLIAVNQVIRHGGRYYAYYHGSGDHEAPRRWTTNVAVSTDRVHWKKYPGNPLITGDRSSGIVVKFDGRNRLYTMHDAVRVYMPARGPVHQSKNADQSSSDK